MFKRMINSVLAIQKGISFNYKAILNVNSSVPGLKLVSYERHKRTGEISFLVQVSGKNIFPKLLLSDIESHSLLSNFLENDQKVIKNFILRNKGSPEMRIVSRTYDRDKKKFIFTVESLKDNKNVIFNDISELTDNIHKFDKADSDLINIEAENSLL